LEVRTDPDRYIAWLLLNGEPSKFSFSAQKGVDIEKMEKMLIPWSKNLQMMKSMYEGVIDEFLEKSRELEKAYKKHVKTSSVSNIDTSALLDKFKKK
jgi:hypothetical protein